MTERPGAPMARAVDLGAESPEPDPRPGDPPNTGPAASVADGWWRRRPIAMTLWAAAFALGWAVVGLPTDPLYAFGWLWTAIIAWRADMPWRTHLAFARDWAPVVVLLIAYNISRGFADNGEIPHAFELVAADRALLGWVTGGQVPTVWLQQRLYDPATIHWWDVLVSWVYFSHFVVTLAAAVVLWARSRPLWTAYMRRWLFLTALGLLTYFLYPAAPPWWASEQGLLGDVVRISTRGWTAVGMHGAGNFLNAGQIASNPVAAMPSLHSAFSLFVVLFFIRSLGRRWRPLLLAYPLAMMFTLVYSGEHYMIDILVGWGYVGATFLVVGLAERWWAVVQLRHRRIQPGGPEPQPGGEVATVRGGR